MLPEMFHEDNDEQNLHCQGQWTSPICLPKLNYAINSFFLNFFDST